MMMHVALGSWRAKGMKASRTQVVTVTADKDLPFSEVVKLIEAKLRREVADMTERTENSIEVVDLMIADPLY